MRACIVRNGITRFFDVVPGSTVGEAIVACGSSAQAVVPVINGKVVHPQRVLEKGAKLELVDVVYGG